MTFSRVGTVQAAVTHGPRLTDPTAEPGTLVDFVASTTPGGGVVAQGLIVIVVYVLYILRAPAPPGGLLLGTGLLILSA